MKKLLITAIFVLVTVFVANAQNYAEFYVTNIADGEEIYLCDNEFDGAIIYGRTECEQNQWQVNGEYIYADYITINHSENDCFGITHLACGQIKAFGMYFVNSQINNPFTEPIIWKRQGESVTLTAGIQGGEYTFLWSNGATSPEIQVTQPGIYYVTLTSVFGCGSETFSVEVRDNVELYRATVDLETNLNKTTWQTTPGQAEYISEVKVYRDGMLVGTALYQDGYFLDAIGSDNAARNYHLVGVTTEGEDCPIESYEKGTIHTTYYQDVNSNLNMTWNIPYVEEGAQGTLTYFQICKYDPNTEELTVVDQVNASITDYTCGVNQFDGGYAVIAAVFNDGKGFEELSFSNLTEDVLAIGENSGNQLKIYPNPANGVLFVETVCTLSLPMETTYRITNLMGQTLVMGVVETCHGASLQQINIENLPQGMYFVTIDGMTRKIVVE